VWAEALAGSIGGRISGPVRALELGHELNLAWLGPWREPYARGES
jgi:hypothetical protein